MKPFLATCLAAIFCLPSALLHAHDANAEMASAATSFVASLTPEQKARAAFEFAAEERKNWHFIPRARNGITFKELNDEQRLLAHALLASGLSSHGYVKAVSIMSLDSILAIIEKDRQNAPARDPQHYCITIFGTPGVAPWGWRLEGHHLSLNFTAVGADQTAMTPSFFGTNPAEVRSGPRMGTRILRVEEDLARQLVKSLSDEQLKVAVILPTAPREIFNAPTRIEPTKPEGLPQNQLTAQQNEMLVKLIKEYLFRCRTDVAAEDFAKIEKAGMERLHFAWAGSLEPGEPHYYRVQGGNFVLRIRQHPKWRESHPQPLARLRSRLRHRPAEGARGSGARTIAAGQAESLERETHEIFAKLSRVSRSLLQPES